MPHRQLFLCGTVRYRLGRLIRPRALVYRALGNTERIVCCRFIEFVVTEDQETRCALRCGVPSSTPRSLARLLEILQPELGRTSFASIVSDVRHVTLLHQPVPACLAESEEKVASTDCI